MAIVIKTTIPHTLVPDIKPLHIESTIHYYHNHHSLPRVTTDYFFLSAMTPPLNPAYSSLIPISFSPLLWLSGILIPLDVAHHVTMSVSSSNHFLTFTQTSISLLSVSPLAYLCLIPTSLISSIYFLLTTSTILFPYPFSHNSPLIIFLSFT